MKVLLTLAPGQIVTSMLELQASISTKTDGTVRTIHLLCYRQGPSHDFMWRNRGQVSIALLDARTFDLASTGMRQKLVHQQSILAMITICCGTSS
jgi:hypothetical protein